MNRKKTGPRIRHIIDLVSRWPGTTAYRLVRYMAGGSARSNYAAVARAVAGGWVVKVNGKLYVQGGQPIGLES